MDHLRPPLVNNNYYRKTSCNRNLHTSGNNYVMPSCSRRSTPSIHTLYQQRLPKLNTEEKTTQGKLCSIVLAIASFIVLIVVLSIAGLALYMGGLYKDYTTSTSNNLITFNCCGRILKGDLFLGNAQEKFKKYQIQFETLYQRSILGPALLSCNIEKLINDTQTVCFNLNINKTKLPRKNYRNSFNIENTIRDILITDAISRKSVLKTVRFDSKSVKVKQINSDTFQKNVIKSIDHIKSRLKNDNITRNQSKTNNNDTNTNNNNQHHYNNNNSRTPSSVVHGSFKISKTEADITEKKTEIFTQKLRTTTITPNLNKTRIGVVDKVDLSTTTTTSTTTFPTTTLKTTTATTKKVTSTEISVSTVKPTENGPLSIMKPEIFDDKPWIPIIPNLKSFERSTVSTLIDRNRPIYTSFTNPELSFHAGDIETLGSTSLKSHPIPVNKIPINTEPTFKNSDFVEIETVKHVPGSFVKNLSSIFHNLATLKLTTDVNRKKIDQDTTTIKSIQEESLGHGQVEVVVDNDNDESILMMQTTKLPLVTLIPVRSNSGIRKPLRQRPDIKNNQSFAEIRSFPGSINLINNLSSSKDPFKFVETEIVTTFSSEINKIKLNKNDFQIVGVLNFATESTLNRNPKMDTNQTTSDIRKLSEIGTIFENVSVISTKAIGIGHAVNHSGFEMMTKTYNKINKLSIDNETEKINLLKHQTDCVNFTVKCGDNQCLPETTKCNQLIECNDGSDEKNCTCADYLKSQYLLRKICDGIVDCWDYSDENQCEWCKPNQYVCANTKLCIDQENICNGIKDCPYGDDERKCVTITIGPKKTNDFLYYPNGYLLVRKYGNWGKVCVENFDNHSTNTEIPWEISNLGKAVCKSMTYQSLDSIRSVQDSSKNYTKYFKLFSNQNQYLLFNETPCVSRRVVQLKCENLECGIRPQITKNSARIVGGGNAGIGSWPWQTALYKEGEFQCGATLLSSLWLVSAGHCFYHSQDDHWVARLGTLRRGTTLPSPYEQLRPIVKIIVHHGYVDSGFINDISLLKMETPVIFSDYVRPICLPSNDEPVLDGQLCTVVGWGQLSEVGRIFPDTLQQVQVPVISTSECRRKTVFLPLYQITDDMFCAGYERGGRDACLGDSGGPLMCPQPDDKWVLQGITSNGYGCARANRPGVYTKVANYINWIKSHISDDSIQNYMKSNKSICAGHRCPLGECLPKNRLCNGYIECSDGSDEQDC